MASWVEWVSEAQTECRTLSLTRHFSHSAFFVGIRDTRSPQQLTNQILREESEAKREVTKSDECCIVTVDMESVMEQRNVYWMTWEHSWLELAAITDTTSSPLAARLRQNTLTWLHRDNQDLLVEMECKLTNSLAGKLSNPGRGLDCRAMSSQSLVWPWEHSFVLMMFWTRGASSHLIAKVVTVVTLLINKWDKQGVS